MTLPRLKDSTEDRDSLKWEGQELTLIKLLLGSQRDVWLAYSMSRFYYQAEMGKTNDPPLISMLLVFKVDVLCRYNVSLAYLLLLILITFISSYPTVTLASLIT